MNEQPDRPKPISTPLERKSVSGVEACAIMKMPAAYSSVPAMITRTVPKRSAMAPENGWAAPYSSVWIATESANTSRPSPGRGTSA